jgi:hypothetical protein
MTTTVFSLPTLAVTEFDASVTGLDGEFETDSTGVYAQAGTETVAAALAWSWNEGNSKQHPRYLYLYATNLNRPTQGRMRVSDSRGASYEYQMSMVHNDMGRFELGRGMRDNWLSMALTLTSPLPIVISTMEDDRMVSKQRRL